MYINEKKTVATAKLAAVLHDDYSVVMTSCCDFIPSPTLGGSQPVTEQADHFFADNDYLVWPQPYHPTLPHLPMISCHEIDLSNKSRRFLWLLPERKDFILLANDTCTGLGMLADPKVSELRAFYNALCTRTQQDQILTLSLRTKPLWNILCSTSPLFIHLEQLAMGFRLMCRTVRAIQ